jgi:hypothetical protein
MQKPLHCKGLATSVVVRGAGTHVAWNGASLQTSEDGGYYLRTRVPRAVQPHFRTKLIKISLRTKDRELARTTYSERLAELLARWAQMRKGIQRLDDRQVEALAGELYREAQSRWPHRERPVTAHSFAHRRMQLEITLQELSEFPKPELFRRGEPEWQLLEPIIGRDVSAILERHGLIVDEDTRRRLLSSAEAAETLLLSWSGCSLEAGQFSRCLRRGFPDRGKAFELHAPLPQMGFGLRSEAKPKVGELL